MDPGLAELHLSGQALTHARHEFASRTADLTSATREHAEAMTELGYRDVLSPNPTERDYLTRQAAWLNARRCH